MLDITTTVDQTKATVALSGRLDTFTAPELDDALKGVYDGITELVIDFADLEYISSAGLRVLLTAQKTMNEQGTMVVTNVNDVVMDILEITGFVDILTIA